jgi:hypothetical protein
VMPQFGALPMVVTDDSIKIFILQVSLKIVTYNCQNSFMVQTTGVNMKILLKTFPMTMKHFFIMFN